ncbi:MAG: hypothetical protein OXN92_02810, partial [Gammaproteobacteria bacterium]|nr:hypothetical protein [Gammaproteobacteria bacterium]
MTRSAPALPIILVLAGCAGYAEPAPPAPANAADAGEAAIPDREAMPDQEAATPDPSPSDLAAMVATIEIVPAIIEVQRGDSITFRGILRDEAGNVVEGALWGVSTVGPFELRSIKDEIPETYVLRGTQYGEAVIGVFLGLAGPSADQPNWTPAAEIPVKVNDYPVARIDIDPPGYASYAGTSFALTGRAITTAGEEHAEEVVEWSSADEAVATVTAAGRLELVRPGAVRIVGEAGGVSAELALDVVANPVERVAASAPESRVRTGDVVRMAVAAMDASGERVDDVALAYRVEVADGAAATTASTYMDGAFVAEEPGRYTVRVDAGTAAEAVDIEVFPREATREVTLVGQGPLGTTSSDLWVFEGLDGRDYAYTGTMSAATMYAWDVTDPAAPAIVDSVSVDGRRVNDVKINDDRTIAIVTSENASNRRNGITLIDITTPADPETITHYTEGLTGGIHNVWFVGDLVYAINDGTLDVHIIDISDPANPFEAGRWGLDKPNKYLHDVSVVDGIAYLSYWNDGLVMLDVGDGRWGGTPTEPQLISSYSYLYDINGALFGNTHHAIRYGDYVFLGDEIFGCPECDGPRGYVHVVDVSDIENPREVAEFRLPDAGSHNLWVED